MSLPPGFLDELRSRSNLTSVVGRKVIWDARKSNQAKGDMWAPCPFHQEKTASFHVDDRKGFYHCFGCHASGDAISFVRETENVGFMEAVEILAREAGMTMPERDPKAREKADRRTELVDIMEQAVRFFRLQLNTHAGANARKYLSSRGLEEEALERWEIGFAPDAWHGLWDHLKAKSVADDLILDAGLAKPSAKGGNPYDTFRNRIIFPIRDARGNAIAFGGRAMEPDNPAKYLNSPETLLFDKGATLFNHGLARAAAGRGQTLLVAEGYMDVIALSEHGFEAAVAPLGTAITERQLQMLWRIAPEPIIALDGDMAGVRAAMRVIDLALPLLQAGHSLRFALMPAGQDPDDLLRAHGAAALQKVLDEALPMIQLLWRRETEGGVFDSPERKSALEKALNSKTALIKDISIRRHYEQELKDLRWKLFRPKSQGRRGAQAGARRRYEGVRSSTKSSSLLFADTQHLRETVILAALATCPDLISEFEYELEDLSCADPTNAALRDALLREMQGDANAVREEVERSLAPGALDNLLAQNHVAVVPCIRVPGDVDKTRQTVTEEFAKIRAMRGLDAEISEAAEDLGGSADEGVTWRLAEAARASDLARRSAREDKVEYEVGSNGARISRNERNALDELLRSIKGGKPSD